MNPYSVPCPKCHSPIGDPCFMLRPPYAPCAWPHSERKSEVKYIGWQLDAARAYFEVKP